ncbi:reverse transcriptase [Caerostris extrusa]|uniref:Reverse transcriptase n=1 Tax=Caerostris extrusa TaxID=172846 RepID=A0AAV4SRJ0_CAEEX|nr:reverse transcriptase [Caerostris extrusa]
MIAWILKFCQNIRVNSHKLTKELSYEEIQNAEEALIRIIQSEWPTDIQEKYAQTIQFYEENKILKVKSRLILGSEDFVRPTVLPDHPIVRRLIDYVHQKLQHAGVQTTLSHLRERFWIPRGRRIVREVLQKCVTCKRYTLRPMVPDGPAPLPANRINRVAAFEVTGTDLADFIQDIKDNETMDLDIVDAKHLRKRIRYLQNLRYQQRQRFQKEYLSELIRSPQSFSNRRKDNVERGARLRVAKGEIILPIQRIYPLELSSSEILNDVPVRVKDSSDTSDNDNQHTISNEQSFEPKDLPKEQLETLKRSRFGRQIVPVKRLDL